MTSQNARRVPIYFRMSLEGRELGFKGQLKWGSFFSLTDVWVAFIVFDYLQKLFCLNITSGGDIYVSHFSR